MNVTAVKKPKMESMEILPTRVPTPSTSREARKMAWGKHSERGRGCCIRFDHHPLVKISSNSLPQFKTGKEVKG